MRHGWVSREPHRSALEESSDQRIPFDLRERIDDSPMTRYQWGTIAICVLLNVLDGFGVLVMAFTAQSVSQE